MIGGRRSAALVASLLLGAGALIASGWLLLTAGAVLLPLVARLGGAPRQPLLWFGLWVLATGAALIALDGVISPALGSALMAVGIWLVPILLAVAFARQFDCWVHR